jgi:hypothetical protein
MGLPTDPFFAGHVECSIGGLFARNVSELDNLPWALLTSVDSLRDLSRWPGFQQRNQKVTMIGQAILVPTAAIVDGARVGMFCGFDEVWFFHAVPTVSPPPDLWIVGPRDVEQDDLATVLEWMREHACNLTLGDGIGLNYIARGEHLARAVEMACQTPPD